MKNTKNNNILKNIIKSEITKRIIYALITILLIIDGYIIFFVGHGNTHIDDMCYATNICLLALQIIRSYFKSLSIGKNEIIGN